MKKILYSTLFTLFLTCAVAQNASAAYVALSVTPPTGMTLEGLEHALGDVIDYCEMQGIISQGAVQDLDVCTDGTLIMVIIAISAPTEEMMMLLARVIVAMALYPDGNIECAFML